VTDTRIDTEPQHIYIYIYHASIALCDKNWMY